MRVTPGETDSLPTRAVPGAPLTRRTSFAATTTLSRRSSNAADKGGDYESGLPLDVVEEPDSLTEHGMPVVFEVRSLERERSEDVLLCESWKDLEELALQSVARRAFFFFFFSN